MKPAADREQSADEVIQELRRAARVVEGMELVLQNPPALRIGSIAGAGEPELAVISTPPETVPGIVEALGRKGTRAAVVITAGFGESKEAAGRERQQALLDAARPYLLRIIGPNCLGILVPGIGLNASFAHLTPAKGPRERRGPAWAS